MISGKKNLEDENEVVEKKYTLNPTAQRCLLLAFGL